MSTFTPLGDRILIDPIPIEETTKSGIILAQTQTNSVPTTGLVIAVGPGRTTPEGAVAPMTIKVGQRVMWNKFAGSHIEVDGKPLLLMRETDIAGVLE